MNGDSAYGWSAQELADMGVPCHECGLQSDEHDERVCDDYVPDLTTLCELCRGTGREPGDPTEPGCPRCNGRGWYE